MHQNLCLDFPTTIVIFLGRFSHGKYPQRILIRYTGINMEKESDEPKKNKKHLQN
jgi:hypothetical protein